MAHKHTKKNRFRFLPTAATLLILGLTMLPTSRQTFVRNSAGIPNSARALTYDGFTTAPFDFFTEANLQFATYDSFLTETQLSRAARTIPQNMTISLDYHGDHMEVSSGGETVTELLARLNIFPDEWDVLSAEPEQPVYDGMQLQVRQVFQEEQVYTVSIPYETSYYYSDALPEGTEQIMTEGKSGELRRTALVTYVNREETQRQIISEAVSQHPTTEVIALGTGLREDGMIRSGKLIIDENTITLPTGEVLTYTDTMPVRATGYNHNDEGCDRITYTGTTVRLGTVAVDPRVIPYGTRMFIVSNDGEYVYGISVAEDCGGAIKGDRMDLYFPTTAECFQFGKRKCTVYFLG